MTTANALTVNALPKGRLSHCESRPFTLQNTVFHTAESKAEHHNAEQQARLYGGNRLATHGKTNAGSMSQLPASAMY